MPKSLPDTVKEEAWRLYSQDKVSIEEIAIRLEISFSSAYSFTRLKERGYENKKDYVLERIKATGYASRTQYGNSLRIISQQQRNIKLANFITKRLRELGKNKNYLAEKIGVTRQAVDHYSKGYSYPKDPILKKIIEVLS